MVIHHQIHQFKSKTTLIALITVLYISMISIVCNAYADTTVTSDVSVTVSSSCTFTAGGGTYSESVVGGNTATITANPITTNCNDPSGYAIYAIGYSGDSYSATTHTDMISSLGSSYNIKTDGTGTYGSSWKMKLTNPSNATISGSFGSSYQNIPSTFTQVATYANNTTSGSITPSYQVAVSSSQPAGTYTGKVKYVLVHPNTTVAGTYTIAYNANGGSGTMSSSTGLYNFEEQTLPNSTFTAPTGYAFAGWCTTNTAGYYACDGTSYSAGDSLPASAATASGTLNLYAYWSELPTMQTFSSSDAATLSIGDSTTLIDSRDGQSYTVTRLADNKIWMTTNLNIAGGTELSSTDTDFESTYTLPTTEGWTTNNGKLVLPASSKSGFSTNNYAYVYNTGNETSTCTSPGCYSYYSWDAATLGSGRSISTDNTDAPYSICPKGWHLPNTYNGSGTAAEATDFRALMIAFGGSNSVQTYNSSTTPTGATISSALRADPYNFLLGGNYYRGSFSSGGSNGYYWSATSYSSSTDARNLDFGSTGVNSADYYARRNGFSVRCVFGE